MTAAGEGSLTGWTTCSLYGESNGFSWSMTAPMVFGGNQYAELELRPGIYYLSFSQASFASGSFSSSAGGNFPVAGEAGASLHLVFVATSEPVAASGHLTMHPPAGGMILLNLTNMIPGTSYVVEHSLDLTEVYWGAGTNFFAISGNATLTMPVDFTKSSVFYRLRISP